MNHFNFFENVRKEKQSVNVPMVSAVLAVCAAVVLFGMFAVSKLQLNAVRNQLSYLESVEENPAFVKQQMMEKQLEDKLAQAEDDCVFLRSAAYLTDRNSTVSEEFVKTVLAYFPKGTKVVKLTISGQDVTIEGVAENLTAMIGVEKKMSSSKDFDRVFIDTVKQDGHTDVNGKEAVSFTVKVTLAKKGN